MEAGRPSETEAMVVSPGDAWNMIEICWDMNVIADTATLDMIKPGGTMDTTGGNRTAMAGKRQAMNRH